MKTKAITTLTIALFLATILSVTPASAGGNITLDDTTTTLHFADKVTTPNAWAYPDTDVWNLQIATSYDALVEIKWFDWYPTNDVYELWVDGVLKGTNLAGDTGKVEVILTTDATHEAKIVWIYYKTNQPIIPGGSYYDITFSVLKQFPPLWWVKASGGGEFYDDWPKYTGHHCTIGLIGMSLSAVPEGTWTDYKGSGVFVDHDEKIVINLDINTGVLTKTGKKEVQFKGTARVKDIALHDKWTGTFYIGLVDDAYGATNRFALHLWRADGTKIGAWHGTLLPDSEVTVWFWE